MRFEWHGQRSAVQYIHILCLPVLYSLQLDSNLSVRFAVNFIAASKNQDPVPSVAKMTSTIAVSSSGPLPTTTSSPVQVYLPDCLDFFEQYGDIPDGGCRRSNLYYLSYPGNIAFAVLFGLCAILHIQQASYYKKVRRRRPTNLMYLFDSDLGVLLGHHHGRH